MPKTNREKIADKFFPIVGIGASAGGLEAFTQLLRVIPADIGMAFMLVQHLDPTKKSLLSETLARTTSLPFIEVTDGIKITENQIYAMPSESYMTIVDHKLHLTSRNKHSGLQKPIDSFFESLAKYHGKDAIGIVLSGTGNDGTEGLQAIRKSGGRTFAQDDSAQFKNMPQSAIDSGSVDFTLPPDNIARTLIQISREITSCMSKSKPEKDPTIDAVLAILHTKTGMDFRQYKQTSVNRRIQRRMLLNHIKTVKEYVAFLTKNPSEVATLHKDMLTHVTSFFREPEQLEVLKKTIFPTLLNNRSLEKSINVWIPGCATGEEAYSLAILFQEFFGKKAYSIPVKIFATDVAEDAIAEASKGMYKENITEHVSPIRIAEFFTKITGGYEVKKTIRDMCEFAVADVIQKPPRLDNNLVSCRNVLIYLEEALQQKTLFMLSSALKPDGFLLLGKAEGLGVSAKLFSSIDSKQKIYSKKAITSVTKDLRKAINKQVGMSTSPLSFQKVTTPQPDDNHTAQQQKIIKLKEAVILTQEYADEIMNELDVMNEDLQSANEELTSSSEKLQTANEEMTTLNEEVTIARDYADAIIRTVRGPLLVLGKDLRIISANESFYKAFKVAPNDTENKLLYDLGDQQWNIPKLKTLLEKILPKNNTLTDYEVVHNFKDIGQKTMLLNARTLQQGSDKTSLILLAIEDITDRKEAEKALVKSEKFSRTANEKMTTLNEKLQTRNEEVITALNYAEGIIKTVREPLVILDDSFQVKSVNESFYKIFKVTPQQIENMSLFELGNKQWEIPKLRRLLEKILPKNITVTDYEVEHDFESIGQKTMLLNARTLKQGPNMTPLILLAIEDITDRKDIDKQKDLFISIASHELKTPITTMKGYAQILEKRLLQRGDSKDAYLIQNINKQTNRLTNLINDLLNTSKIQAGKLILEKNRFDLNALVSKTIVDFQYATDTHQFIKKGEIKEEVFGDQGRIEQVLSNLINNAIKYSPKADKIIVRVGTDKNTAIVSVQDFGFGIEKCDQVKVFERFYRTSDKDEMSVTGFGLGLYIAAEIIKGHHGKIWIESTKGKGSTFYFTIPIVSKRDSV